MSAFAIKDAGAPLASPIIDHINACHAEFVELGIRNTPGLIAQINKAREIGLLLTGEKSKCRHGEWQLKFQSAKGKRTTDCTFAFSHNTACNYVKVAKALPEPITSLPEGIRTLADIYRNAQSSRALNPSEGDGPSPEFIDKAMKHVNSLVFVLSKWREDQPIAAWSPQQRETFKDQIKPLVDLYNELEEAV